MLFGGVVPCPQGSVSSAMQVTNPPCQPRRPLLHLGHWEWVLWGHGGVGCSKVASVAQSWKDVS